MRNLKIALVLMLLALVACGPATVDQATDEAAATLGTAVPSLPPGAEQTAAAAFNDPTAQALVNQAGAELEGLVPSDLRLQSDQPLVLDTTRQIAGVTNYKWTIAEAPAGAEGVRGQVIQENSSGKLTIEPADYAKYFPVSGTYTVNLDLTFDSGTTQTVPIPVVVP